MSGIYDVVFSFFDGFMTLCFHFFENDGFIVCFVVVHGFNVKNEMFFFGVLLVVGWF